MKRYALIGAPSSAGANAAGLEQGPAHFRKCGMLAEFASRDIRLSDYGDCPKALFTTDPMDRTARNLAAVAAVARNVRAHCETALSGGEVVVLIGGDCTVSVGLVAAARRKVKRLGLVYMDSQTDLNTPATTDTGILDSMGLAHMLGLVKNALSGLEEDVPLLDAGRVCVFGFHPQRITSAEHEVLSSEPIRQYSAVQVTGNAAVEACTALAEMERACDAFVLHFDVDVIDFTEFPAADAPVYRGFGLGFGESLEALGIFAASEKCTAVSVTEFNPDRDKDLELGRRFTAALSLAFSGTGSKSAFHTGGI